MFAGNTTGSKLSKNRLVCPNELTEANIRAVNNSNCFFMTLVFNLLINVLNFINILVFQIGYPNWNTKNTKKTIYIN